MSTMIVTYIVLAVIAILVIWIIGSFNGLVSRRNRAKEALSDIDVQTKRRYDLIPNLVETVKGYMEHEKEVFEKVSEARSRAMGASSNQDKAEAENQLSGTLKTLFAVSENYPQLKANENFLRLQDELSDTENKIQAARRFYNGTVMDLNTRIQTFPSNMIAGMFGFQSMDYFGGLTEAERQPVSVKF